jgi:1,2-diacylglycerol 3-alpha-glucosyltransferase
MLKTAGTAPPVRVAVETAAVSLVVVWIDWYAYHLARFRALIENRELGPTVAGIELVGGAGVHAGYKFREERSASLPVETLFPGAAWQDVSGAALAIRVWNRLNRLNPSVVLIPGYYTLPAIAAALWARFKRRRPVLMTESTADDRPRHWWKEAPKRLLLHLLFDWAVAGGASHRRYLTHLGFRSTRIARFYDVVDNAFFRERAEALRKHYRAEDFDLPERYFLFVGRLAAEKNVDELLAAYLAYRRRGGAWSLVLVGDGPRRQALEAAAAASGFSGIHFEGLKKSASLPQYYAFAGCFVLPSRREPWGLVVNEAMASGLPVIVSRQCGCAEDLVADRGNGFVFDASAPGELENRLLAVSTLSRRELGEMGARSANVIARFSPEAWAAEVARIANEKPL